MKWGIFSEPFLTSSPLPGAFIIPHSTCHNVQWCVYGAGMLVAFRPQQSASRVKHGRQNKPRTKPHKICRTAQGRGLVLRFPRTREMRICLGKKFRGCLLDKRALGSSFIHKSASTDGKKTVLRSLNPRSSLSIVKTVGLTSHCQTMSRDVT